MRDALCGFRGRSGRPPRAVAVLSLVVLHLATLHLAALLLSSPGRATELSASDRKIAEAGREGRALLRDVQREQAAQHGAAPGHALAPSPAVERQAAKMRSGLKRDAGRRRGSSPVGGQDGVALSRGICVGCLK